MKLHRWVGCLVWAGVCTGLGVGSAVAAPPPQVQAEPAVPLTAAGEALQARYAAQLAALQAAVLASVPRVDEAQKAAFIKAYTGEATARASELRAMRAAGGKAKDKDAAAQAHAAAQAALALAATNALAPAHSVLAQVGAFLADEALDAKLIKCVVLLQATPRGLAEFAQQGKEQESLVERLLVDDALLKQMLLADGARGGKYGRAMQIYTAIQKASPQSREGVLQRLALATSLEHAMPISQSNPQAETNAPAVVDPVGRYLHFEQAYLGGELDPAFKTLSVWDYRNVVNGDEPDATLAWGRTMLRNYRPDLIETPDDRWRYVKAVKTDVQYGSAEQKFDLPTQQVYQNIIKTGGVCGRRAWFGGFILRCFGIPIVRRPQEGHAALAHWTPGGWVVNLGAGWEWGWTKYGEGLDFEANTQARRNDAAYRQVQRAQWVGDVMGEKRVFGFNDPASGFWNGVALYRQRAIVEESKAVALAAVGQDIAEANVSKEADTVAKVDVPEADKTIAVGADGVITVPAVAGVNTTTNTGTVVFMKSNLGGMQLHYNRLGNPVTLQYTVDVPRAGTYALAARVVTVSSDQTLLVAPNAAGEPVVMNLPYTVGMWQVSTPVEVALEKGKNTLTFSRKAPYRGVTIRDFTLTPVK